MQINDKKGLSVKDLVTIGIFSALFLVFALVGGIFFAPNPVLTFYMPVGSALLCGPMYLLMLAKVQNVGQPPFSVRFSASSGVSPVCTGPWRLAILSWVLLPISLQA